MLDLTSGREAVNRYVSVLRFFSLSPLLQRGSYLNNAALFPALPLQIYIQHILSCVVSGDNNYQVQFVHNGCSPPKNFEDS
jgi:hypothetical protein